MLAVDVSSFRGKKFEISHVFDSLGEEEVDWMADLATRLILVHASGLHRRVVEQCSVFPLLLLKLVAAQPNVQCQERLRVAALILSTPEKALEANALKLRKLYPRHLHVAATSGKLPAELWYVLAGVRSMFKPDVREMERINKVIKLQEERAPRITTDLLSARVALKHYMGEGGEGKGMQRTKWTDFKVVAQKLQNTCVTCWDSKREVLMNESRFAEPDTKFILEKGALEDSTALNKVFRKLQGQSPAMAKIPQIAFAWAASYNMLWQKHASSMVDGRADAFRLPVLCVAKRKAGARCSQFSYYVIADKVRTSLHVAPCSLDRDKKLLQLIFPLKFKWSLDILADCYTWVNDGHRAMLFAIPVTKFGVAGGAVEGALMERVLHSADVSKVSLERVLEMKRPSQHMKKKMAKVCSADSGDDGPEHPHDCSQKGEASADCDADSTPGNTADPDQRADADDDIQEGLNCLLEESEASGDFIECSHDDGNAPADIDPNLLDAQNLFSDLLGDRLRDDSEKYDSELTRRCEEETDENIIRSFEKSIASNAVDNGVSAQHGEVQRLLSLGASEEEAVLETVLNSEEALGNGNDSCENQQGFVHDRLAGSLLQ